MSRLISAVLPLLLGSNALAAQVEPVASIAEPVTVSLEVVSAPGLALPDVLPIVFYRRGDSANPSRAEAKREGVHSQVTVGARGVWYFTMDHKDLWCTGEWIEVPQKTALVLTVLPLGKISFSTSSEQSVRSPESIRARFRKPLAGDTELREPGTGVSECVSTANGGRWECDAPAGEYDVELSVPGHSPVYLWGVSIPRNRSVSVGSLRLRTGASLTGYVAWGAGLKQKDTAAVVLDLAGLPAPQKRLFSARPDKRGFFQFHGLPPAEYRIRAVQDSALSPSQNVVVLPETEARLRSPLTLSLPARLALRLDPPLDEDQQPWGVEVSEVEDSRDGNTRLVGAVSSSRTSLDGRATIGSLGSGKRYRVLVRNGKGQDWHTEYFEMAPERTSLEISMGVEPVRGDVRMAGRPVVGEIEFGGGDPGSRIRFRTNEEGEFEGLLPRLGEWEIEVTSEAERIRIRRILNVERLSGAPAALLSIRLPAGRVRGRVVRKDGSVVDSALLDFRVTGGRLDQQWFDGGHFELSGLPPGDLQIRATSGRDRSEQETITIEADDERVEEIELVLLPGKELRGRIISNEGQPIAGAKVYALNATRPLPLFFVPAYTDELGRFSTEVDTDSDVSLAVLVPGFGKRLARVRADREKPVSLVLSPHAGNIVLTWEPQPEEGLFLSRDGAVFLPALWFQRRPTSGGARQAYELTGLEPGNYTLCSYPGAALWPFASGSRCVSAVVSSGAITHLNLPPAP